MNISFATNKLQKVFNAEKELVKAYGSNQAKKIRIRLKVLENAANLAEVPAQKPERRHQLIGDRKEQFAVDLVQPFRLIFKPEVATSLLPDGGYDLTLITGIIILGVEDYHGD